MPAGRHGQLQPGHQIQCKHRQVRPRLIRGKDRTRAITWSQGLTLPSIAGVTVSSQSGFSTKTKVIYKGGNKKRQVCGHRDWPALNPGSIKLK